MSPKALGSDPLKQFHLIPERQKRLCVRGRPKNQGASLLHRPRPPGVCSCAAPDVAESGPLGEQYRAFLKALDLSPAQA